MDKKKKNNIIGTSIFFGVVLLIFLPVIINSVNWDFLKNIFNKKIIKYEECVKSCEDNKTCIKFSETETTGLYSGPGAQKMCLEYNVGDCLNICIQKYK